jgi:hypothetical protein
MGGGRASARAGGVAQATHADRREESESFGPISSRAGRPACVERRLADAGSGYCLRDCEGGHRNVSPWVSACGSWCATAKSLDPADSLALSQIAQRAQCAHCAICYGDLRPEGLCPAMAYGCPACGPQPRIVPCPLFLRERHPNILRQLPAARDRVSRTSCGEAGRPDPRPQAGKAVRAPEL